MLDQNNPNPFKETTFITCTIPNGVKSATIVFYDMNGRMIKELNITESGENQLQVYGSDLSTDIYTYALVIDGKVYASKKMVKINFLLFTHAKFSLDKLHFKNLREFSEVFFVFFVVMNHKLSAVIIMFNEEKNIRRCIEGLLHIADEIIVVDSFSFDKTKFICQSFKEVRFIEHKWEGYSHQKNFANNQAQYNYIFSVDADEVPSEELKAAIIKEKLHGFNGNYSMNRLTNYCGAWVKHGGWYPDKKIRIFPKNNTQWEGDFVHEILKTDASFPNKHLTGDLLHYSYHSVDEHLNRIEKYSTLHAQQMKLDGKKASIVKLFFGSTFKFFSTYILKLGFLDGKAGWNIAKYSAKAVSLKYHKLKQLYGSAS